MITKTIFITGATSGFGKAAAEIFAANGYNCIITGRRKDKLQQLATTLTTNFNVNVLPLVFDVQNKQAVFNAINAIPKNWQKIDVLLNNAGLALGRENFDAANIEDWETMIQTNVNGLLYVSKAVLPFMIDQKNGHVINIGSVAAKDMYQYGNVYCASKAAVNAISHTMRIDLLQHKIKVTAIHPGAAETEFAMVRFKGNAEKAKQTYNGITPLTPQDVANIIFYCASLPAHVCINDLVVTCTAQADGIYFNRE